MSSEQWKTGLINVTNASQIAIGTASCDWLNQLAVGQVIKIQRDGESTYQIGNILSASRMILSAAYAGSTGTGLSYVACRSFTTNRGYWRVLSGDSDWAEIMSAETIDKIDTDIANILSGNASLDGTAKASFGINTGGNTGRFKTTNLSSSHDLELPDVGGNIVPMAPADYSASPTVTASIVGNASISGQLAGFKKFYTVLGTPFAVPYWNFV